MQDIMKLCEEIGIIPALSFSNAEDVLPIVGALKENAVTMIEILCRTEQSLETIQMIKKNMPDMIIGAGTVLNTETARAALEAGAQFIVSPGFNSKVVQYCIDRKAPVIPGCITPTEIETAMEYGLHTLKYFPGGNALETLKLYAGSYPKVKFIPTGGIDKMNFRSFLQLSNVCAVGGGFIADKNAIAQKDWQKVKECIKETISLQFDFKIAHVGINCENLAEAESVVKLLTALFNIPVRNYSKSIFAGNLFEVMKSPYYGTKGHVGIYSKDVHRAHAYFKRMGYSFIEQTAAYDDTTKKLKVIYFADEIGGLAFHLLAE